MTQFIIIHRYPTGDMSVMPGIYASKQDAEIDCDRYAGMETNAQHTYSPAYVSSTLRISDVGYDP